MLGNLPEIKCKQISLLGALAKLAGLGSRSRRLIFVRRGEDDQPTLPMLEDDLRGEGRPDPHVVN